MSERDFTPSEFEQNWPVSDRLSDHEKYVGQGLDILHSELELPVDGRWDVAYAALTMGDPKAAVLAEGDPGTGKTQFGNVVLGEQYRTDIASTDTAETLEGYQNPINEDGFIPGKMPLREDDPRFFLNEISHVRDTGPMHKYWDGGVLYIDGHTYSLDGAPVYATTNFADGRRAKDLDDALRSRMGVTVLAGDNMKTISPLVQGRDLAASAHSQQKGILPGIEQRRVIREQLLRQNPLDKSAGAYMASVIEGLNGTGLLMPISGADARIGQGWQQAVRALRLAERRANHDEAITPEDLSVVAALALGSVAILGQHGRAVFEQGLSKVDSLSNIEKAVAARRVVSAVAHKTVHDMRDYGAPTEEKTAQFMDKRSYAEIEESDVLNGVVLRSVFGRDTTEQVGADNEPKRRKFQLGRRTK